MVGNQIWDLVPKMEDPFPEDMNETKEEFSFDELNFSKQSFENLLSTSQEMNLEQVSSSTSSTEHEQPPSSSGAFKIDTLLRNYQVANRNINPPLSILIPREVASDHDKEVKVHLVGADPPYQEIAGAFSTGNILPVNGHDNIVFRSLKFSKKRENDFGQDYRYYLSLIIQIQTLQFSKQGLSCQSDSPWNKLSINLFSSFHFTQQPLKTERQAPS